MGVILVVDDEDSVERLMTQRFRKEIRDGEFSFLFASNGRDALAQLQAHPEIECVITDINMPEMDGLTLLSRISEINPLVRTVIISAYGDLGNIRAAMNRGAFDFLIKPLDFTDLRATMEKTLKAVSDHKAALEHRQENQVLRSYVNPAALKTGRDRAAKAERIDATVGFLDVCGFTRLSEQLDALVIRELLNTYFDLIAQETLRFGGVIDKYIGDAALVFFEGPDHLSRAVRSVLSLQNRIRPFLSQELAPGVPYPALSAGLNSGPMISGEFGSQTIRRFDFTVIGDVVNVAARVESLAGPGQILVPSQWGQTLEPHFHLEDLGAHKLYNKKDPLGVFGVVGLKEVGLKDS